MPKASEIELKKLKTAILIPLFFLIISFGLKLIETLEGFSFVEWGVKPLSIAGLPGILLSPLVHADWEHLGANAIPLLVLGIALFYFYRGISLKVFLLIYLFTGAWVWVGARDAWHIGASGIIYGLGAFLFLSGVIRNHIPLIALSLIVVFLYGSMVWGALPVLENVPYSWESHLYGSISGFVLALVFRKEGPQKPVHHWPEDEEEDNEYWKMSSTDASSSKSSEDDNR